MPALSFRHVDACPDDPVEDWPTEAVEAALARGSLEHWARLAAAIRARPWGPVARRVEAVLTYTEPYGVGPLFTRAIAAARTAATAADRVAVADDVRQLLTRSGLTQAAAARELGTSASRLSTYANGSVTPSAAFMVALRRLADAPPRKPSP